MLVFHSFNATLPIYIERFSGSVKYAGLAISALTVASITARLAGGFLLDRYGRKLIFLGGIVLFLIPTVTFIWMLPVTVLIILRFFQGLGWGITHTASNTVAMDIVPRERVGEGMGFYTLSFTASSALAPAIALWFIYHYSFKYLFIIASCSILLSMIIALSIKYPSIELKPTSLNFKEFIEISALRPAVTGFIVMFTNSVVMTYLPLFVAEIGLETGGLFFTTMAIANFFVRPITGITIDRLGLKGCYISIALAGSALITSFIIVSQASILPHLLIGGLIYGVGGGLIQSSLMVIVVESVPASQKGRALATYWASVDLGVSVGSFFWGFIAYTYGYRLMYNFAVIPIMIALLVFFTWRSKKAEPTPSRSIVAKDL